MNGPKTLNNGAWEGDYRKKNKIVLKAYFKIILQTYMYKKEEIIIIDNLYRLTLH